MIVKFSCQNIYNFLEETTLDLVASSDDSHGGHVVEAGGAVRILKAAVIYGANAAGKSNFVRALKTLLDLVSEGTRPNQQLPYHPFRLDENAMRSPTVFDLTFMVDGVIHRYGVVYNGTRIIEEQLTGYRGNREVDLFTRQTSDKGEVVVRISTSLAKGQRAAFLRFVAEGTRPNQPFLTECAEKNVKELAAVLDWFASGVVVINPNSHYLKLPTLLKDHGEIRDVFCQFLQNADTGIGDLSVEEMEVDDEELGRLPAEFREELPPASNSHLALNVGDDIQIYTRGDGDSIRRLDIRVGHRTKKNGKARFFPISDESDGTRRLMHLIPMMIPTAIQGPVFVVDELNRSLHPLLSRSLVQTFLAGEQEGSNRQLILTTHETLLLDLDILRRDEIWFMEKDRDGSSSLRSLQEYKVRKDLRIEKGYLSGRFGAIPIMGAPLCGQEAMRE